MEFADSSNIDGLDLRWVEYRSSFLRFADERARLQELVGRGSDPEAVENAATSLEFSRLMHNEARDDLAAALLRRIPLGAARDISQKKKHRQIRDVAELLWQCRGQPETSAVEDWLLAERVVDRALERVSEVRGHQPTGVFMRCVVPAR